MYGAQPWDFFGAYNFVENFTRLIHYGSGNEKLCRPKSYSIKTNTLKVNYNKQVSSCLNIIISLLKYILYFNYYILLLNTKGNLVNENFWYCHSAYSALFGFVANCLGNLSGKGFYVEFCLWIYKFISRRLLKLFFLYSS